jgi:hypothetical protein
MVESGGRMSKKRREWVLQLVAGADDGNRDCLWASLWWYSEAQGARGDASAQVMPCSKQCKRQNPNVYSV